MGFFGVTTAAASLTGSITDQLGLSGWQLKAGKYNGCTFIALSGTPILDNSSVYQAGVDIVATYNQSFGDADPTLDPNRTGQLYNTKMGVMQFSDKLISGKVIKNTPYTNSVNIEDTGFKGYEFKMSLVFFGEDYQKALANFETAILKPPSDPSKYLVLEHPIRGKIEGYTYVVGDLEIACTLALWRGCVVNVTFRSVQTPESINAPELSLAQKCLRALQAGLRAVNAVGGAIGTIVGTAANVHSLIGLGLQANLKAGQSSKSTLTYTQYYQLNQDLQYLSTVLYNCILYVYKYSGNLVEIGQLSDKSVDYSYIPKSLNQLTNYSLNQGSIILSFYDKYCQDILDTYSLYNDNGALNDLIITINTSIAKLAAVCETLGNKVTNRTYITPENMSIRRVLSINNIPLNKASKVMSLNQDIPSSNYIPAGTVVNLI